MQNFVLFVQCLVFWKYLESNEILSIFLFYSDTFFWEIWTLSTIWVNVSIYCLVYYLRCLLRASCARLVHVCRNTGTWPSYAWRWSAQWQWPSSGCARCTRPAATRSWGPIARSARASTTHWTSSRTLPACDAPSACSVFNCFVWLQAYTRAAPICFRSGHKPSLTRAHRSKPQLEVFWSSIVLVQEMSGLATYKEQGVTLNNVRRSFILVRVDPTIYNCTQDKHQRRPPSIIPGCLLQVICQLWLTFNYA